MAALKTAKTWIRGTNETELPAGPANNKDNLYPSRGGATSVKGSTAPNSYANGPTRQRSTNSDLNGPSRQRSTSLPRAAANGVASRQHSSRPVNEVIRHFEQSSRSSNGRTKRAQSPERTFEVPPQLGRISRPRSTSVSRRSTGNKATDGDDLPEQTFEIPLDKTYSVSSNPGREKPTHGDRSAKVHSSDRTSSMPKDNLKTRAIPANVQPQKVPTAVDKQRYVSPGKNPLRRSSSTSKVAELTGPRTSGERRPSPHSNGQASKQSTYVRSSSSNANSQNPASTIQATHSRSSSSSSGRTSRPGSISSNVKQETASNSAAAKDVKQEGTSNSGATKQGSSTGTGKDAKLENAWKRRSSSSAAATTKQRAVENTKLPVTGVAAAAYNGGWLPFSGMVSYPNDVLRLNKYLNDCRSEVEAGVPGRYLTAVMGSEVSDLDSIMSTIAYAYFLCCTGGEEQQCFVPVINMRREDLALHTEAVWLFEVTGVDTSNFIFVDQISLSYYHRFGSLRLVLVDHSRLAPHQENLQEAVVEIVDHNVPENLYPWVSTLEIEQVGSCCTIIAERYAAEAPELLAGRGVNRLLLGPILLDTANLEAKFSRCTSRDGCMAAFLINGAGRYGQHGFFRLLRKMKFDVSILSTKDMMRKDFKQWTLGPGKTDVYDCKGRHVAAGMTTIGVPLIEFLSRGDILDEMKRFRRGLKLDVHLVVTGYYDNTNRYKREILVVPEDDDLTQHIGTCFSAHREELKLSPLQIDGLPKQMMVFVQGNVAASRKTIRRILVDFFSL